jgi:O-antigen ligase
MRRTVYRKVFHCLFYPLLFLLPFSYGAVQPWSYMTAAAVIFFLFAYRTAVAVSEGGFYYINTGLSIFVPAAILFFASQIIPIPDNFSRMLSSGHAAMSASAGLAGSLRPQALYPWAARLQGVYLMSVFLLFFLVLDYSDTKERIQQTAWSVLVAGVLVGAAGTLIRPGEEAYFPFVNRNHFAGYLEIMVPLALGLVWAGIAPAFRRQGLVNIIARAVTGPDSVKAFVASIAAVVLVFCILATHSRGAVFGLAASLTTLVLLLADSWRARGLALVVAAAALAVLLAGADGGRALERAARLADGAGDNSAVMRVKIWKDTAHMIKDFPALGVGLGSFETAYPSYKTFGQERSVFQPESDWLYILSEGGIAGFVIAGAFLLVLMAKVASRLSLRRDGFAMGIAAGGTAGACGLVAHGLVDTGLHMPAILFTVTVVLALSISAASRSYRPGSFMRSAGRKLEGRVDIPEKLIPKTVAASLAAVSILAAAFSVKSAAADVFYRQALSKEGRALSADPIDMDGLNEAVQEFQTARKLGPGCSAYPFEEGRAHEKIAGYNGLLAVMDAGDRANAERQYQDALGCYREAVNGNPFAPLPHFMAGRVLIDGLGQEGEGESEVLTSERLNPTSPTVKLYLAELYGRSGRLDDAVRYRAALPPLDPRFNGITITGLDTGVGRDFAYIGEKVVWRAEARVPSGSLVYSFYVWGNELKDWKKAAGYSESNTWEWDTSQEKEGKYFVMVRAAGAGGAAYDTQFVRDKPFYLMKGRTASACSAKH